MIGKLNETEIDTFLKKQFIGRIGCLDMGKVYIVPITYVYRDNYIYGHTRPGKKIDVMRENPNVCFESDTIGNMHNWESVIAWGVFEELEGKEANNAIQILMNRTHGLQKTHWFDIGIHGSVTYRIRLTEITGRYEKKDFEGPKPEDV